MSTTDRPTSALAARRSSPDQSAAGFNLALPQLPPRARALIVPSLSLASLKRGQVLARAGEQPERVYFPLSGAVALQVVLSDGRVVQSLVVGAEGMVNLACALSGQASSVRAVVQERGEAFQAPALELRALAQREPQLLDWALRNAAIEVARLHQNVACAAVHTAEQRICRWLLAYQACVGRSSFDLTHQVISEMVGIQRTSVGQIAAGLQRRGAIRCRRGRIEILRPDDLRAAACECQTANPGLSVGDRPSRVPRI